MTRRKPLAQAALDAAAEYKRRKQIGTRNVTIRQIAEEFEVPLGQVHRALYHNAPRARSLEGDLENLPDLDDLVTEE